MIALGIHDCEDIVIEIHMPNNDNSLRIQVKRKKAEPVTITMFGMSDDLVNKMISAFGAPKYTHRGDPDAKRH